MRELPELELNLKDPENFGNLAEKLDPTERKTLATDIIELVNMDKSSMSDWLGEAEGFLETAEAETKAVHQNQEQRGADEADPPSTELTLAAVIQFAARAAGALLSEPDLIRASKTGGEDLAAWLSDQLRAVDPNWILETDPLLGHMAVTGLAWRKRTFDEIDEAFHSNFLTCSEVIINKNVKAVERAPRITHDFQRYPYEIERSISRNHWIDYDPQFTDADPQAPKNFYECDLWLDLDGDGIDEPWTVVISRDDMAEVVKIRPRWSKKTIVDTREVLFFKPIRRFYPYRFLPNPKGGFFPLGFGKLLKNSEGSADRLLAAIVDTAESESQNGGVMAGGGTGLPSSIELKNNRVTTIETDGRPLQGMFEPFPVKQVSPASVQILEKVITLADRISGTLNTLENAPASMTATLAKGIIDNGTQVQSAVHRRIVTSLTQEAQMFAQMADAYDQLPEGVMASAASSISVTADPQLATEMQRAAAGNLYMGMLEQVQHGVPWQVPELMKRFCEVMRIPQPEKLIGQQQPPQLSPAEKAKALEAMQKAKTAHMAAMGKLAVDVTTAIKNLVDANGGTAETRLLLLQAQQLETVINEAMQGAAGDGAGPNDVAPQPGDGNALGLPPPAPGGDGGTLPQSEPGGPDGTGQGVGAV